MERSFARELERLADAGIALLEASNAAFADGDAELAAELSMRGNNALHAAYQGGLRGYWI